jgi:hypothetical protein
MRLQPPYKFSILQLWFAHWSMAKSHVSAGGELAFSPLLAVGYGGLVDIHCNLASPVL